MEVINIHFQPSLLAGQRKPNRLLPSSKNPQFQNEAKSTTFLMKMSFICMRIEKHFHIKGWALNLILILGPGGTRHHYVIFMVKTPIDQWALDITKSLQNGLKFLISFPAKFAVFPTPFNAKGSLCKSVFERRKSTGNKAFSPWICLDATKFCLAKCFYS